MVIIMLRISSANTTLQFFPLSNHSHLCIIICWCLYEFLCWMVKDFSPFLGFWPHMHCIWAVQIRAQRVIFICSWEKFGCVPCLVFKCLCITGFSWPGQAKLWCCLCWVNQNCILVVENGSHVRWVVGISQLHSYSMRCRRLCHFAWCWES